MYYFKYCLILLIIFSITGCALFSNENENLKPISNPFYSYQLDNRNELPIVLRSKKGDRSVEIEIPDHTQSLSDFTLPISTPLKSGDRNPHLSETDTENTITTENFQNHRATPSDEDITHSFPQGSLEDQSKRQEIEKNLNLMPSDDNPSSEGNQSYLAGLDHIKQLYRNTRYEAALIETDDMISKYQTAPQLYEMKGTLLERLGKKELALKSWKQALKLNPENGSLRKFIDQRQSRTTVGLQ